MSEATIVSIPAPSCEPVVSAYRVTVNGVPVAVYTAMDQHWEQEYYFASFDFSGEIEVCIESDRSLSSVQVLPEKFGIKPEVHGEHSMSFKTDKAFRISIEREHRVRPLLLFGNDLEQEAPSADDANVVYFGPGWHDAGKIELTSGQTLYLAAGAVVNGSIHAVGEGVTICGRGILAGEIYERFKGPGRWVMDMDGCRDLVIKDIMIRNPWTWILVCAGCDGVLIDNVKICGSRMINDDGIDLCNTRNVEIRNCFIRAQDDIIAIKGMGFGKYQACEHYDIHDCEFWTDSANIYRIGYECNADCMRDFRSRDIDVLHYAPYRGPENYWSHAIFWFQASGGMVLSDCVFDGFRIYCTEGKDMCLIIAKAMVCQYRTVPRRVDRSVDLEALAAYSQGADTEGIEPKTSWWAARPTGEDGKMVAPVYSVSGSTRDCVVRNVTVVGERGEFRGELHFEGRSELENVSNMLVENVEYFGEKVTATSPCVTIKDYTDRIVIR